MSVTGNGLDLKISERAWRISSSVDVELRLPRKVERLNVTEELGKALLRLRSEYVRCSLRSRSHEHHQESYALVDRADVITPDGSGEASGPMRGGPVNSRTTE